LDSLSSGKYVNFVRLMGRAASNITLECALQTHPTVTLIGASNTAGQGAAWGIQCDCALPSPFLATRSSRCDLSWRVCCPAHAPS